MDWQLLFIGSGAFYFFVLMMMGLGFLRLPRNKAASELPAISVVVAARNEDKDLPACISSLLELDYPSDKLEIILVDDRSTDSTLDIIKKAASDHSHIKYLSTKNAGENNLEAKARGIAWGAKHAKGEWIFITDADAVVQPQWLKHMLWQVNDEIGMIGGTLMINDNGSLLSLIEKMSLAYTLPFAAGSAGWGLSIVGPGPNLAIRRSIYEDYGGLESVEFGVAEDLALTKIVQQSGKKVKFHGSSEVTIRMTPVPTFDHLISQQRRWIKGGFEMTWEYWAGLIFVFTYHFIFSWILLFGWIISVEGTLIALAFKLIGDFFMVWCEKRKISLLAVLRYIPIQSLYTTLIFIWLPVSFFLARNIRWKGEGYEIKYD